jgi:hypothetical protein
VGLATMLTGAALFLGCSGGGGGGTSQGTPAGFYNVTVSATSAGVTHSTALGLTVR